MDDDRVGGVLMKKKKVIDRKVLEELLKYKSNPMNVVSFSTPPCVIYKQLKCRVQQVLDYNELDLFMYLLKIRLLAWMMIGGYGLEHSYNHLWKRVKETVSDMLREIEVKENDG